MCQRIGFVELFFSQSDVFDDILLVVHHNYLLVRILGLQILVYAFNYLEKLFRLIKTFVLPYNFT